MTRYAIKLDKNPEHIVVPDFFVEREDAHVFINKWNLKQYSPKIIEVSEEDYHRWLIAKRDIEKYEDDVRQAANSKYDLTDDGTGKKYDTGKSMVGTLSRVFSRALLGVGQTIEFGTRKYPKPDNWKKVEGAFERYQDSMMRHYLKFLSGEERDSETNILHLCHMAWNALAITELYLMNHPEYDKELFK